MPSTRNKSPQPDVVILGAGAAGLMCALESAKRGRRVLVLEKARAIGEKIRISGGGRCNFTNIHTTPENFLSENPDFCRSALSRFTPQDFLELVDHEQIPWHEKKAGQLFCTPRGGARLIVEMLHRACLDAGPVSFACNSRVTTVEKTGEGFRVVANGQSIHCGSVVVATGGPSVPQIGASGFGYEIAKRFDLEVVSPRPALVPLTLPASLASSTRKLSGISLPIVARCNHGNFREAMLFTHRGLSGPAVLQISSYWSPGDDVAIDLLPHARVDELLAGARNDHPRRAVHRVLEAHLPRRLASEVVAELGYSGNVAQMSREAGRALHERIHNWKVRPSGTEGFRTAEVTRGGVSTHALSSRTMETRTTPGLYFIGEVVDVTGQLGGFNFQWAWASGYAAGQAV